MKKKVLVGILIGISCISLAACSAEKEQNAGTDVVVEAESVTQPTEKPVEETPTAQPVEEVQPTEKPVEEAQPTQKPQEQQQAAELTFEDLSKYSYSFMSGAGGWSTDFKIEKDGFFHGLYHDSDMGSTGEGYENGTFYMCSFEGKFKNLKKISDLCYEMELDTVTYANEAGTSEIIDNVLYAYTDWYGLEGTEVYRVYLPGTPIADLSEEVGMWIRSVREVDTVLDAPAIVNEPQQYGIYSCERQSAKEEAEMVYHSCQDSYDYYLETVQDAYTTMEMFENADCRYQVADDCLNDLWRILKYNVSEERFQTILEEQREWVKQKEAAGEEAAAEFEGGTFAPVSRMDIMAGETLKRCGVLLEYINEYAQ